MDRHVNLIGIFWIALGALNVMAGFLIFGLLFGISFIPDMGHEAPVILRSIGFGLGLFLWAFALPKIIAGIGLLKKLEWGRVLALVVSFLSLLNIPLGTALGIYSIVILVKEETILLFKKKK